MDGQQGLCELCGSWPECVMWPAYSKVYFGYRVKYESRISEIFLRRIHKMAALKIFRQTRHSLQKR